MKTDLHVHSTYSDGKDTCFEMIDKAHLKGVTTLSFVDHDTTVTFQKAQEYARQKGIDLIPGIEISAYDYKRNRKVHILGYGYQRTDLLEQLCGPLLKRRHAHSLWQIEQIQRAGIPLSQEEVQAYAQDSQVIYKQHIMNALLPHYPYEDPKYQQLYRSLFKGKGVAAGDIDYIDCLDAVRVIKTSGGIAAVAHPGQLDSFDCVPELVAVGLDAIEYNHPSHSDEDQLRAIHLAETYQLLLTSGSDDHGDNGSVVQVGDYSCVKGTVEFIKGM